MPVFCEALNSFFAPTNPFGSQCECVKELIVEPGCHRAFYCANESGQGCYIVSSECTLYIT